MTQLQVSQSSLISTLLNITRLKGLRTANLNVNSLIKHIDEIRITLANSLFDILAINESKLDDLIPDSEIYIFGYNIIRKDRNRNRGGVALYIRDTISNSERKNLIPDRLEMMMY